MTRTVPLRRALGLLALGAALSFALPPSAAVACTCAVAPAASQFDAAATVFAGTVIGVEPSGEKQRVKFEVRSIYKGSPPAIADVQTPASADACGIQFIEDASYLVFASPTGTSLCAGTTDDLTLLDRAGYRSREVSLTEATGAREASGASSRTPWLLAAALALGLVLAGHARHFARVMR